MKLNDPEVTAHLLGNSKHTSILQADVSFVRLPLETLS